MELTDILPFITAGLAIIGVIIGLIQYADTKNQEFKKRIWEERKSLYFEVIDHTSKIAIADEIEDVSQEVKGFWSMYFGRLSIIEDASVYYAMINYGKELKTVEADKTIPNKSSLKNLSFKLALACRKSLQSTWEPVEFEDLGELDRTQRTD